MDLDLKNELITNIREWIQLDNDIRELNKELRNRKKKQETVSKTILDIMRNNEIDEFNVAGGKLLYAKKTIKKPITKKSLTTILSKYYKGDISQALELNTFIMSNREEVVKESIQRKINKVSLVSNQTAQETE